jgi:hypothetical protein
MSDAQNCALWPLPLELVQQILHFLSPESLKAVSLVSRAAWVLASDFLWADVVLIDCNSNGTHECIEIRANDESRPAADEHNDTPIIQKLLILARYGLRSLIKNPTV